MRPWFLAAIAMLFTSGPASASSIGVYFDREATTCEASIPIYTEFTWYHIVRLGGDALEDGFTAAEYRQTGTPTGWIVSVVSNPFASLTLGSPLTDGALIAFQTCQNGPNGIVLLATVTGFATSEVSDAELQIEAHTSPSNPNFQCPSPNLLNCSAPLFTRICVAGSDAVINRLHSRLCLDLAVQPSSWTGVKSLYQR